MEVEPQVAHFSGSARPCSVGSRAEVKGSAETARARAAIQSHDHITRGSTHRRSGIADDAMTMALLSAALASSAAALSSCPPGSVPWPADASADASSAVCEPLDSASKDALAFLKANIFPFDEANEATYFDGGIAGASVQLALSARQKFGWAARVPKDIWRDAVLPYAVVNEARNDWRPLLWAKLLPTLSTVSNSSSLADVFKLVNAKLWGLLGSFSNTSAIVFRSEQTPLIYDPMST